MIKEDIQSILGKLNKAKVGGEKGAGVTAFGDSLVLSSRIKFGIPTRIPELDLSIGKPGWPAGRLVELYGLASTGKTTAAYHALAQCQRMGGLGVFIDTEKTFDVQRAIECGVDPSHLLVSEAYDIEEIFEKIQVILDHRWEGEQDLDKPIVMVVDSITAVETRYNAARNMNEEARVGEDARAIRRGCKKVKDLAADCNATIIFINHATAIIGNAVGKKSDSAGGNTLKLLASLRIEFQKVSNIYEGAKGDDDRHRRGQISNLTVIKNKINATGAPEIQLELTENGFDLYTGLFDAFMKIDMLEKVNNQTYLFVPTQTQLSKKEWRKFVDGYENKDGKVLGIDGFYNYFLQSAQANGHIEPYGAVNDT